MRGTHLIHARIGPVALRRIEGDELLSEAHDAIAPRARCALDALAVVQRDRLALAGNRIVRTPRGGRVDHLSLAAVHEDVGQIPIGLGRPRIHDDPPPAEAAEASGLERGQDARAQRIIAQVFLGARGTRSQIEIQPDHQRAHRQSQQPYRSADARGADTGGLGGRHLTVVVETAEGQHHPEQQSHRQQHREVLRRPEGDELEHEGALVLQLCGPRQHVADLVDDHHGGRHEGHAYEVDRHFLQQIALQNSQSSLIPASPWAKITAKSGAAQAPNPGEPFALAACATATATLYEPFVASQGRTPRSSRDKDWQMRFEAFNRRAAEQRADCLVIGVFERGELGPVAASVNSALRGRVAALLSRGDFSGRAQESLLLPEIAGLSAPRLLLVGLGTRAQYNRRHWRRALQSAMGALARTRIASAALALERPAARELDDYYFGRASAEIVGAALYRVNDLKSARRARPTALARVRIGPVDTDALPAVRRGLAAGEALSQSSTLLRNLANLPANVCTPRYLANQARELQRSHSQRLRVRIFDEAAIRRLSMGCLLAVTRGSEEPPRFIVLEYRGTRRNRAPIVLVGKGVTFDTGGISLKDPQAMDEMKYDMCGAATVIAAMDYVARAGLPLNVVGLVPACENMPDGRAVKPGDIVTSAS